MALRFGWHQPLLTDLDGLLFGLVVERPRGRRPVTAGGMADAGAGTLDWLRHVLREVHAHDPACMPRRAVPPAPRPVAPCHRGGRRAPPADRRAWLRSPAGRGSF
ncbi:hypothetical protein ACR6C2_44595 [Streptomyces sp. INA 01156]